MVLKIGLTGGIGSGKSTACKIFSELGVPVIDADVIANQLVTAGTAELKLIVKYFGERIIKKNGYLDKVALRKQIFSNESKRKKLESILHPAIYKKIIAQVRGINAKYCIIAIPLLIESNATAMVDRILVIDASKELQLSRALVRDSVEEKNIDMIIRAQISRGTRNACADDIISNTGDIKYLHKQVSKLHYFYKAI